MVKQSSSEQKTSAGFVVAAIAIGMFGLAYASVPLYNLFCRVTGFGGTPRVASALPDHVLDRTMEVHFNTDVVSDLPWKFKADKQKMTVRIGEQALAFFEAENTSDKDISGTAIYNVSPEQMGAYLSKIQCFCFDKQLIKAGQKIRFPVTFFIDPAMVDDKDTRQIGSITLSYTFFRSKEQTITK